MTKTLKDLGKLKRELEIEIPFEEIKPSYDEVFSQLKSVTLRGFRPGKFPKGWLQKRFNEQMAIEARDHVIPRYFRQIAEEIKLQPATQAKISDLSFATKKPMNFKLTFEIQPDLELIDYKKLKLEKLEYVVEPDEIESMIVELRESQRTFEDKPEDCVAEAGDMATYDFTRTIGDEISEEEDFELELDDDAFPEIKQNIIGMRVGERRAFSFEITEDYMDRHLGEIANFELTLKNLERIIIPEMNADFFQLFDNAENEEAFRQYVIKQLEEKKAGELRFSYHDELKKQLLQCYDDFELPEQLIEHRRKDIEEDWFKWKTKIDETELRNSQNEELNRYKTQLRIDYIIQKIADAESLQPDEETVAQRFAAMAQLWGIHPNEFINSQIGPKFFRQIFQQVSEEQVLDFLVEHLLGPSEVAAVES